MANTIEKININGVEYSLPSGTNGGGARLKF